MFFVPCTLTYPLVLEAASLIGEFLGREGGPHFVDMRDEFERPKRWVDFLHQLAELDLQVHVRFGNPLDIVGNVVDTRAGGISRDRRGRAIDPSRYLFRDGVVVEDHARDAEYTRLLSAELAQAIRRESVALPSSLLAYAAFRQLRVRYPGLDVLRLLRVLGPHASLPASELRPELEALLGSLRRLAAEGAIRLAPELAEASAQRVLEHGARTLARYHREPVVTLEGELLHIHDPALLMYYRNRLAGFGLAGEREDPTAEVRASRRPLP
jgi:glycerol-3-phosphate O-acyltransferase